MALANIGSVLEQIRSRIDAGNYEVMENDERVAEVLREVSEELSPSTAGGSRVEELFQNTGICLVGINNLQRIVFLNREARQLLGEDAIDRHFLDGLALSSKAEREVFASLGRPSREALSFPDHEVMAANGDTRIIEWRPQVVHDPLHEVAVMLTGIDVTERARREQKLRESERQLFEICNTLPALIAYIDSEERYQFNNAAYQWVLGLPPKELKGRRISEVLDDKTLAKGAPHRTRVLAGEATSYETQVYDREGYLRDARVQYTPHCDEEGKVVGFFVLSTDVTETKRLEKALRHSQKMEALGQLASGCAHDFNNLMMGISGCANVALSRVGEGDPSRLLLEEIRSASAGGASISRQLLNFTHDAETDLTDLPVDATIKGHAMMLKYLLGPSIGMRLELHGGASQVRLVQGELEQLLMNLFINARDAMPDGGEIVVQTHNIQLDESRSQRFRALEPGSYLRLEVSDTGTGMDAATVERIFEPFFTTKGVGQGTGLGLSAVYGTVSKAGGTVEVDSNVGEGTTFTIFLPCVPDPGEQARPRPQPEDTSVRTTKTEDVPKLRSVLLVEDDRLVRMSVRHHLSEGGFHVMEAETGTEAIARAREYTAPLALLITDMVLPGVNGAEVAKEVRRLHPEVSVIGMSAHSPAMLERAGNLGADMEIMEKPFDGEQLLRRVHAVLTDSASASQ